MPYFIWIALAKLHMFIGYINYYHDMWPSHAHILKLLTDQSGLKKKALIKWTDKMQKAFDKMNCVAIAIMWKRSDSLFLGPCWILFSVCLSGQTMKMFKAFFLAFSPQTLH
jgi:hypothetical protein